MGFQGFVYAAIATDQRCRSTESLEKYAKTCHRQYRRRMLSSAVSELRRMLYPKKINSRLARATGGGKLEERKKKKQKKKQEKEKKGSISRNGMCNRRASMRAHTRRKCEVVLRGRPVNLS
ncbi:hypothetical protein R5R35_002279 [Gryllus longicercus]|uniref:Uncharacterized protein n=1 Tax=Gryllus longicercus TaxID=2509291 RepID=A0AAN9ZB80_9ORTH